MTQVRLVSLAATFFLAALLSRSSDAQDPFRVVAITGQPAPDTGGAVFQPPTGRGYSLNGLGQVAFTIDLSDGRTALYTEAGPGTLQLLAITGDEPVSSPEGTEFLFFREVGVILNDNGVAAFEGTFSAPGDSDNKFGVWHYDTVSGVQLVARSGDPLVGQEDVAFPDGYVQFPLLNHANVVVSHVDQPSTTAPFLQDRVLEKSLGGSLQTIAMSGTPADFTRVYAQGLSDGGHVVLRANHPGSFAWGAEDPEQHAGIWMTRNGALEQIAATRDTSFGFDFGRFDTANVNNAGDVVFAADLFPSGNGVFMKAQNEDLRAVALNGQASGFAPGVDWGFSFPNLAPTLVDSSGRVAFEAQLSDGREALYREDSPGVFELLALTGEAAPGQENADWYDIRNFVANRSGQVALLATFLPNDGSTTPLGGLWIIQPNGELVPVVAAGDEIEVAPGDVRSVLDVGLLWNSNNEDGQQSRFNDHGQLAFDVKFEDGTVGYFVSSPLPVPEPGSLALATTAILALLVVGVVRRRRNPV